MTEQNKIFFFLPSDISSLPPYPCFIHSAWVAPMLEKGILWHTHWQFTLGLRDKSVLLPRTERKQLLIFSSVISVSGLLNQDAFIFIWIGLLIDLNKKMNSKIGAIHTYIYKYIHLYLYLYLSISLSLYIYGLLWK